MNQSECVWKEYLENLKGAGGFIAQKQQNPYKL
jgi:hypothetical protein